MNEPIQTLFTSLGPTLPENLPRSQDFRFQKPQKLELKENFSVPGKATKGQGEKYAPDGIQPFKPFSVYKCEFLSRVPYLKKAPRGRQWGKASTARRSF
jgi:hypothetical protein